MDFPSRREQLFTVERTSLTAAPSPCFLHICLRPPPPAALLLLCFDVQGLQKAYYNPGAVTSDIVDSYRMPQLVRGWEEGMFNFLLARLSRPG